MILINTFIWFFCTGQKSNTHWYRVSIAAYRKNLIQRKYAYGHSGNGPVCKVCLYSAQYSMKGEKGRGGGKGLMRVEAVF